MSTGDPESFGRQLRRVESLVEALEGVADPTVREAARELVKALLELHREALARLLGHLGNADTVAATCEADERVAGLLLLHGLHPMDLETRVRMSVERLVHEMLAAGIALSALAVADNVVRIRIEAVTGATATLRVYQAILAEKIGEIAPDAERIEIEIPEEPLDPCVPQRMPLALLSPWFSTPTGAVPPSDNRAR